MAVLYAHRDHGFHLSAAASGDGSALPGLGISGAAGGVCLERGGGAVFKLCWESAGIADRDGADFAGPAVVRVDSAKVQEGRNLESHIVAKGRAGFGQVDRTPSTCPFNEG